MVTELLQDVVARGVDPKQKWLFIIDGSKALRAAINAVFGADQPVQRYRAHKLRNVLDHLPEEQKEQVKSLMRAAWQRPTSSKVRMPECASEPAVSPTGKTAPWSGAGWLRPS